MTWAANVERVEPDRPPRGPSLPPTARAQAGFWAAATLALLAGGIVAAAGGEVPGRRLSWAAAYLVLVCGLAQALLGGGQFLLAEAPVPRRLATWQLTAFNLGNAGVLAGTLAGIGPVLDVGSAVLLGSLGLFAWATRRTARRWRLLAVGYRAVLAVLFLSIPAGIVLAH